MNVTPIARTWHPALLPPVIPTGEQTHRLIELANMLDVTGRDWHDAAFATGIYRCANSEVA